MIWAGVLTREAGEGRAGVVGSLVLCRDHNIPQHADHADCGVVATILRANEGISNAQRLGPGLPPPDALAFLVRVPQVGVLDVEETDAGLAGAMSSSGIWYKSMRETSMFAAWRRSRSIHRGGLGWEGAPLADFGFLAGAGRLSLSHL